MTQLLQTPPKSLKLLIAIKDVTPETAERARALGITIKFFEEIETLGAASDIPELVCVSLYVLCNSVVKL